MEHNQEVIYLAAQTIKNGDLVAFPTETVYGLGANALNSAAVKKIFVAKGRPTDNPLIVHIANLEQLSSLVTNVSSQAQTLIESFWPGPLTLIFPASKLVPPEVTAGGNTVAIRMPSHPVALALINQAGVPVAAPSANKSGKPSPTTAQHVIADFSQEEITIVDAGPTQVGVESTVLDVTGNKPVLLRAGGASKEDLEAAIGPIVVVQHSQSKPKSPGMKYRHYAPQAQVELLQTIDLDLLKKKKGRTAVLQLQENKDVRRQADLYFSFAGSLEKMSQQLFSIFRQCDEQNIDFILVEAVPPIGLGLAITDRVQRAAQK